VTESPVLGKVREQFADVEQSSLRNDIFLGARSYLSSECLKRTHRFLIKHHMHMSRVPSQTLTAIHQAYGGKCRFWVCRECFPPLLRLMLQRCMLRSHLLPAIESRKVYVKKSSMSVSMSVSVYVSESVSVPSSVSACLSPPSTRQH